MIKRGLRLLTAAGLVGLGLLVAAGPAYAEGGIADELIGLTTVYPGGGNPPIDLGDTYSPGEPGKGLPPLPDPGEIVRQLGG